MTPGALRSGAVAKAEAHELFGNPQQQEVMRRGRQLWEVVQDDHRMAYFGRAVSLAEADLADVDRLAALARLQGVASVNFVDRTVAGSLADRLAEAGLETDGFRTLRGGPETIEAAQDLVAARALPADLTVETISANTSVATMAALDALTAGCGVLLPLGAVMRGLLRPAVCLLATDREGTAVACAASVAICHPEGRFGNEAWWGMLATRADRRGEGIALVLGAMAMLEMRTRHGFDRFMTGVRHDNEASARLCAKLAVVPSDYEVVTALDPAVFQGGRMTK